MEVILVYKPTNITWGPHPVGICVGIWDMGSQLDRSDLRFAAHEIMGFHGISWLSLVIS